MLTQYQKQLVCIGIIMNNDIVAKGDRCLSASTVGDKVVPVFTFFISL